LIEHSKRKSKLSRWCVIFFTSNGQKTGGWPHIMSTPDWTDSLQVELSAVDVTLS